MTGPRLTGKVAFVTGATGGIGRAIASRLAEEGATLALADLDPAALEQVTNQLRSAGARISVCTCDAMIPDTCRAAVTWTAETFGRIDVVVNVAGVLQRGRFEECTPADWDRVIGVNLTSQFHVIQEALPHLIATGGNIVNIASTAANRGVPFSAAYSASKHGVVGLTKSLAAEFADRNVRVNAICPGPIPTAMLAALKPIPGAPQSAGRVSLGTPEDIAAAVAYLASDEARFVTGAALTVDGGLTAA